MYYQLTVEEILVIHGTGVKTALTIRQPSLMNPRRWFLEGPHMGNYVTNAEVKKEPEIVEPNFFSYFRSYLEGFCLVRAHLVSRQKRGLLPTPRDLRLASPSVSFVMVHLRSCTYFVVKHEMLFQ